MKKKYFLLSGCTVFLTAVLFVSLMKYTDAKENDIDEQYHNNFLAESDENNKPIQESEEVITISQQEGVVTFEQNALGNILALYDLQLQLPEGMVVDTGVTESDTAFAFTAVDDLHIMFSAGESAVLEGSLAEMSEEGQEAYRIYTDFDMENMYLIDSDIIELENQVFVMNSYCASEEKCSVLLMNTVVEGISYSISGYTMEQLLEEDDAQIIIAMASALEVKTDE